MLYLKFFYIEAGRTRHINSPALINPAGLYEDAFNVYCEEGKFNKRYVKNLEAIWLESTELQEVSTGEDFSRQ